MIVVRCVLFGVSRLSFWCPLGVVCCLLLFWFLMRVVCCVVIARLLFDVSCSSCVICCLLYVVCWLGSFVFEDYYYLFVCCLLFDVLCVLFVVSGLRLDVC